MHAIVIVHKPTDRPTAEPEWHGFLEKIGQIKKTFSNAQEIQENIWQISLENGLNELVDILSLSSSLKFSYRVLMLEDEPNWLTS